MASALRLMKTMDLDHGIRGIAGVALDSAVGFGTSYALGQAYHRFHDKWYGKHAPKLLAIGGKLGAMAMVVATGGRSHILTGMLDSAGQAGLNAYGLEMGLEHARKATGRKVVMLPKGAALPAGAEAVSIGSLPSAAKGRALSVEEIEQMAQMR